ncbi:MAG: twin-arginine translocase TatA/TatE family subunit [Acidobacteriaceae bacterium]|jgi:sec-independent protein translocase protein TatB
MHFGDSIFIFLLALVLFGPKKLPEIGRTIGKLLAEFRRASNEFKFQIQEELRNMEDEERRKKLAEVQALKTAEATPATLPEPGSETPATTPTILPPSTGTPVSTSAPFATPVEPATAPADPPEVTPSPAEIAVAPGIVPTSEPPAPVDLTAHSNGTGPATTATVESAEPSESLHHG